MSTTTLHLVQSLPVRCSEAAFVDKIIDVAHLYSWLAFHARPARTAKGWRTATQGDVGFVDLVLVSTDLFDPHLIFWECKTERGTVTEEQRKWIGAVSTVPTIGKRIWADVVRPSDFPWIVRLLSRGQAEVMA